MKRLILFILLLLPVFSYGQMKVYTVAGSDTATSWGDGGLATNAKVVGVYGLWMDRNCNLYFADDSGLKIRKVNTNTGIITTIAGTGIWGDTGNGGPATDARLVCTGLYTDAIGDIYFANNFYPITIRKVDAVTGIITAISGNGTSYDNGIPATDARLRGVDNVYGDNEGNIYIAEYSGIRKINTAGIITSIAGTGTRGFSGDGNYALDAQVDYPKGMLFDDNGNFYFADEGNHRIRKIDPFGIISTYAGTDTGHIEDGAPATNTTLGDVSSFVIDYLGNIVYCDKYYGVLRRIDAETKIVSTIAGVYGGGLMAEGIAATEASIPVDFMYLDRSGNIYVSYYVDRIRKVTGYLPGLAGISNGCGETAVPVITASDQVKLYPNPVTDVLHINTASSMYQALIITNSIGQTILQQNITAAETAVPVSELHAGVYYIRLRGSAGVAVKRFVKE